MSREPRRKPTEGAFVLSNLFKDQQGVPLAFTVRREVPVRLSVEETIIKFGGRVRRNSQHDTYILSTPSVNHDDEEQTCYDFRFIYDCVAEGKLKDISGYLLHVTNPRGRKRRLKFSKAEDEEIKKYLIRQQQYGASISGNKIWQEYNGQLARRHPWQSIRDRALKILLPKMSLPTDVKKSLSDGWSSRESSPDSATREQPEKFSIGNDLLLMESATSQKHSLDDKSFREQPEKLFSIRDDLLSMENATSQKQPEKLFSIRDDFLSMEKTDQRHSPDGEDEESFRDPSEKLFPNGDYSLLMETTDSSTTAGASQLESSDETQTILGDESDSEEPKKTQLDEKPDNDKSPKRQEDNAKDGKSLELQELNGRSNDNDGEFLKRQQLDGKSDNTNEKDDKSPKRQESKKRTALSSDDENDGKSNSKRLKRNENYDNNLLSSY